MLLFFCGFFALLVSFTVALVQYTKNNRMGLSAMCFAMSVAVMISGYTAAALEGVFRKEEPPSEEELAAAQAEREAPPPAHVMLVSWDDSIYHRGEPESAEPAPGEESGAEEAPTAEGETPAEGEPAEPAESTEPTAPETPET